MASDDIQIDADAVRFLAQRIESVRHEIQQAGDLDDSPGIGSKLVREALHDFSADWSDKRKKLADGLDKASDALRNTADTFTETDGALASSLNQPAGG